MQPSGSCLSRILFSPKNVNFMLFFLFVYSWILSLVTVYGIQNLAKSVATNRLPANFLGREVLDDGKKVSEVAFLVFDLNEDNIITPLELRTSLRAFGYPQSLKETKALLDNFDVNLNYKFERSEFFEMLKTVGLEKNEDLKTFWKQHDILTAQHAKLRTSLGGT